MGRTVRCDEGAALGEPRAARDVPGMLTAMLTAMADEPGGPVEVVLFSGRGIRGGDLLQVRVGGQFAGELHLVAGIIELLEVFQEFRRRGLASLLVDRAVALGATGYLVEADPDSDGRAFVQAYLAGRGPVLTIIEPEQDQDVLAPAGP